VANKAREFTLNYGKSLRTARKTVLENIDKPSPLANKTAMLQPFEAII